MGLKIIIVGGSISGLSLANMLERFDIEYILLERHSIIAPQLGASIGLLPSGLRILDQLGCYEKIRKAAGDVYYRTSMRLFSGKTWTDTQPVSFSQQLEDRLGYPQIFIDRKTLLHVLFDKLMFKDRVLTNKMVVTVDLSGEHVTVHTQDGAVYSGDIVVGADGVHSAIRSEMWRLSQESRSGLFKADAIDGLQSESKCIFGISKRPAGLTGNAIQVNSFFKSCNYMMLSAPDSRLYWFLFTSLDRTCGKSIPKFTKEDERALAENHFDDQVTETTTFGEIYAHRLHSTLVALEDHVFPQWHFRRIITIGDAAHKVHPISAQGGNGAMETAAVLVNTLRRRMANQTSKENLNEDDIESVFAEVQAKRFSRVEDAVNQGCRTTAASIKETFFSRLFVDYFFPRFGQSLIWSLVIKNTETGPTIDDIPIPARYEKAIIRHRETTNKRSWSFWSLVTLGPCILTLLAYSTISWTWSTQPMNIYSMDLRT
ncbi:uncharacterized protein BDZ83DRAFT_757651 [Colletotrichum acutatum]|uniref:FAD-binding domain-containing protein n=1 Tax=Glomerella acutata TaxID=27357 RepID=A0AAD8UDE0_GLOAC|nr:uncharacterized protein BDZ83DRAFT_757651 [Colletotrichum acutatum]KAK1710004.1 hypothetical protein BDZ83DRAFT_757651 [Colletotrichum acutatum]